jgi:hypothetical protein
MRYVAFLDILGWAALVTSDFDFACETYKAVLDMGKPDFAGLESLRVVSDSIVVVGTEVWPVLKAANAMHFIALANDCLVRGGVALGRHVEFGQHPQSHIVSEALIKAVRHERTIEHPCVVIDPLAVPAVEPSELRKVDTFLRPMLFYEGRWIVNPFNIMWGVSAATRVTQLREAYPTYADKYDWFLRLYQAVAGREPLVP